MKLKFSQSLQINLALFWKAIILVTKVLLGIFSLSACILLLSYYKVINLENYLPSKIMISVLYLGFHGLIIYLFRKPFNETLTADYRNFRLNFAGIVPTLNFYLKYTFLSWVLWELICAILEDWFFKISLSQHFLSICGLADKSIPSYFTGFEVLISLFVNTFIVMHLLNQEIKAGEAELHLKNT